LRIHRQRIKSALVGMVVLVLLLVARLIYLQLFQHDLYITQSEKNRVQLEAIAPTRGLIFDRNGLLLADNRPSYSVQLIPERVKNMDEALAHLASIIALSEDQIRSFKKRVKYQRHPFEGVSLKFNLSEQEIAAIAVDQHRLLGVEVKADLIRHYPENELFAHAIGYVARINEKESATLDPKNYSGTNHIGKNGIELSYETELHGTVGYQKIEKNAHGRIVRMLEKQDPIPGNNLYLSLDLHLQKVASEALQGQRGALVAIDTHTGDVLAFVSTPSYNPNLFVSGISQQDYAALRNSPDRPLFNRVLHGQYPPASTIKPYMGLAALNYGVTNWSYRISDPGWYQLKNDSRFYRDWKKWGHGSVNLEQAIAQSCDTYFYEMAHKMGIDRIHHFLKQFGYGESTGIDLTGEVKGLLPSSAWKKAVRGAAWYPGETLNIGIGQGYMLATPLQMANAVTILANKGERKQIGLLRENATFSRRKLEKITLHQENDWEGIATAMVNVTSAAYGTARASAAGAPYKIAGKTGTAQVRGIGQKETYNAARIAKHHRDHALFIAFAPADAPQIAVALIVENGNSGSGTAAPIARKIFDAYLLADKKTDDTPLNSAPTNVSVNSHVAF
ncbi:MAG TPA: penicillin-binding protein 2, partial [Pseudomonadales bacterium]|nr:penicillin-binding protein 2 [Pseudomonadales bacterium]